MCHSPERTESDPRTPAELSALFEEHWERLFRLFIALGENPEDADDLVQDTFTLVVARAASRSRSAYAPGHGPFWPWLKRVGVNCRVNRWRQTWKHRHTSVLEGADVHGGPDDTLPEPLEALARAEDLTRLRAAIQELTPPHRVAVILYYCENFTCVEIAEAEGVPVGTVYSRLNEARARLRARLECPDSPDH